jgi:cell division protein FtsI/penicillin-binding protein 2
LILLEKQVLRKILQNWREKSSTEGSLYFVAFAPKDNPKIAIAILVENGGFGATIAGPIASLMIEKYLRKK